MKKTLLLFGALFVFVGMANAQEGIKAIKKASRFLVSYNVDQTANADKLTEAKDLVMAAFESDEVKNSAKAYQVKGDVFSKMASKVVNAALLDPETAKDADMTLGVEAVNAYMKAYELAEKKFEKKDAVAGLKFLDNSLSENMGIVAFQNENWKAAYDAFQTTLSLGDFLKGIGEESNLTTEKMEEIMVNSVSVASQENSGVELGPVIEKAIGMNIQNPTIFQLGYNAFEKTDKTKALNFLTKGIEMFPEDTGLLFTQINYYLTEGKLELLIDKLKAAIVAEPENAGVYSILGNTYDQLYSKMKEEGNEEKAEEYFNGALDYYNQATKIDPNNFNSYYGLGVLYFNKAAKIGAELNEIGSDYSAEGIKKYDALKEKMTGFYEQSFPFLEQAEKINGEDPSVLQALREYYARTGKLEKSNEYKMKIEKITGGGN